MKKAVFVSLLSGFVLASSSAFASPQYPTDINADLAVTCAPRPCTLCHSSGSGGGAPVTGFGIAMVSEGLVADSPASLKVALNSLDQKKLGGVPSYIDSLKACNDPNAISGGAEVKPIGYGCAAAGDGAVAAGAEGAVVAAAVACALAFARRMRLRQ